MDLSTPTGIFLALQTLFTYTSDLEQYGVIDDQRSHVEAVIQGKPFRDDCDGFALTARDLLRRAGYGAQTQIVYAPKLAGGYQHMITIFWSPAEPEKKYTMDNEYPSIRSLEQTVAGSLYRIEVQKGTLQ